MSEKALMFILDEMGKKLEEYMGGKAYREFCTEIARKAFLLEVDAMKDTDFKEFILANINEVMK